MKPRRAITAHVSNPDIGVNASLTRLKLLKRIRDFDPTYKPRSLYQSRMKCKQAACRTRPITLR